MNRLSFLSFIAVLVLGGCTSIEGDFPSLTKRAFESANPAIAPPPPLTLVADRLPAAMENAVANLVQRHQKAQDQYVRMLPGVQEQAARAAGSAVGGETWATAQIAVSRLDRARADSVAALADMDALIEKQREQELQEGEPSLIALLETKQKLLVTAVTEQETELDRLAKQIGL
jgi:hypothetical protein